MGHVLDDAESIPTDHACMRSNESNEGGVVATTLAQMVADARFEAREILPAEAAHAHNHFEIYLIVDVREPHEYAEGHLPDAVNIPRGLLEIRADPASPSADPALSSDHAARVLLYCTRGPGARSALAAQTLASMGYTGVEVLRGGLMAWAEAGMPVEAEPEVVTVDG
jgi:rhodanese-related sulfurtransferase